jgi:ADP-ribose pyrophosphatase
MHISIDNISILLNDFFKIEEVLLKFEKFNGTISEQVRRLNLDRGNSVGVLLRSEDSNDFLFVNQFRYASFKKYKQGWIDEIVAGSFNDNNPIECAQKEVLEETGFKVNKLIPMGNFYVSPGGTCEKVFLYFARVSEKNKPGEGGGLKSENEDIIIKNYSENKLLELLNNDYFKDAKTIVAIQRYFLNKKLYK